MPPMTTATQPITPELQQWIVDQARAGHSPDVVLKAMTDSGWNEEVAVAALEQTARRLVVKLKLTVDRKTGAAFERQVAELFGVA